MLVWRVSLMTIINIIISRFQLFIKLYTIELQTLVLILLFVIFYLICALLHKPFIYPNINPGLTPKQSLNTSKYTQNRNYSTKSKVTSILIPISLAPKDITDQFGHKIAVTGTIGTALTYQDMFKMIPIDTPKNPKSTNIFHNRLFVAWDIETVAVGHNKAERVYIISWVVRKGKTVESGIVSNLKTKFWDEDNQIILIREFLKDMIATVVKVNGREPKELNLYAHNSGIFDLHVIIKYLVNIHLETTKNMPTIIADKSNDI